MTRYLLIAVAVLTALLVGAGKLYLMKVEDLAVSERNLALQKGETQKAIAQINGLKAEHVAQLKTYAVLQKWKNDSDAKYQKEIRRLNEQRESSQVAAKKFPERFSVIATYKLRRGMRNLCRAGGGTADDCKIEIPKSAKAKTRAANKSNSRNNGVLAN